MKSVGIRELRQSASVVLRQVENGVTFEVTDRGRPIALLVPIPDASPFERLRGAGDVDVATGDMADLRPPPRRSRGQTPPSVILARLRVDER